MPAPRFGRWKQFVDEINKLTKTGATETEKADAIKALDTLAEELDTLAAGKQTQNPRSPLRGVTNLNTPITGA